MISELTEPVATADAGDLPGRRLDTIVGVSAPRAGLVRVLGTGGEVLP